MEKPLTKVLLFGAGSQSLLMNHETENADICPPVLCFSAPARDYIIANSKELLGLDLEELANRKLRAFCKWYDARMSLGLGYTWERYKRYGELLHTPIAEVPK